MADDLPEPVSETGVRADYGRAINKLTKAVRKRQLRERPGQRIRETPNGTTLETGTGSTSAVFTQDWFY